MDPKYLAENPAGINQKSEKAKQIMKGFKITKMML